MGGVWMGLCGYLLHAVVLCFVALCFLVSAVLL